VTVAGRTLSPLQVAVYSARAAKKGMTLAAWLAWSDAEQASLQRRLALVGDRDVLARYAAQHRRTFHVLGGAP
jgi:hypothetical protein